MESQLLNGSTAPKTLVTSNTVVSITENTTAERILAIYTVPANLLGLNGTIKGEMFITHTSNANAKTYKVYLGDVTGAVGGLPTIGTALSLGTSGNGIASTNTTTSCSIGFFVGNRASAAVNAGGFLATRATAGSTAINTATINTAAACNLVITATKGVGTDTITLETLMLQLFK